LPRGKDTILADDESPVCQILMSAGSRFPHPVQRQRPPAGKGNWETSRCALWPHRRHSMNNVAVNFGMRKA
jgi:hypothetical protein